MRHATFRLLGEGKEMTATVRAGTLTPLDEFLTSLLSSPSWNRIVLKYFTQDGLDLMARGRR